MNTSSTQTVGRFAEPSEHLADVVAVSVTPFHTDGSIDGEAHAAILRRMVAGGVRAITINGNTGEFYALTSQERQVLVRLAVEAIGERAFLIAAVGHDLASAVTDAEQAVAAGCAAVMVHQPVSPYVSRQGWLEYHRSIAAAVPDAGIVLYLRDPRIGVAELSDLLDAAPNIVAVKYAVRDVVALARLIDDVHADRLIWLAGLAELYAPASIAVGARGFTSGLANVAPTLACALMGALRDGNAEEATAIWSQLRPFEELRAEDQSADNVAVVKEALHRLGLCGRDVRLPSRLLDGPKRERVAHVLSGWSLA
jgi:4-hydroxy-tetrahydrodipicolinate synthase